MVIGSQQYRFILSAASCRRADYLSQVLTVERDACAYRLCHPNVVPMETAEPID